MWVFGPLGNGSKASWTNLGVKSGTGLQHPLMPGRLICTIVIVLDSIILLELSPIRDNYINNKLNLV